MKWPLKYLEPYQKHDQSIFFGRNEEIEKLFKLISVHRIAILYGKSGTGKTSLVKCGLAGKYSELDFLDIYIRRENDINISLKKNIREKGSDLIRRGTSIVESLDILYHSTYQTLFLIFDQFEEIFISGTDNEISQFKNDLQKIITQCSYVKIILILREEYLGRLNFFEDDIPDIGNGGLRMRLEKMGKQKIENVIREIISETIFKSQISRENIDTIFDELSDNHGEVDLPYLQIYLKKLFDEVERKNLETIDINKIVTSTNLEDILDQFLEEQLLKAGREFGDEHYLWELLKRNFITEEGTKCVYYPNNTSKL
ncbi:nSTAND1 domain-containing NTPase [Mangrovivirga cuniculi]|uniref:Novel STAND NTPase 1 domain-containing protein n=1 Tax=Mangrovivirga cuniculi TaxID=2715131 RepID=A0A4D7JGC6_9BACT|nr:ATP-binding protein [Mangrovivirga cuniculi]QCK15199.1 hypothetical protein DCC35_10790 [Mangrovivirga cuniculi]